MTVKPRTTRNTTFASLRLMATSDLHMKLWPYNYYSNQSETGSGLAELANLITACRSQTPNTLLFDVGDCLQGTPMGDLQAETNAFDIHPMIAAMNTCGFDAATPGNHDFNYGADYLQNAIQQARFPYTSANICQADGKTLWLPPFLVLERQIQDSLGKQHIIKVAVIGALPPQTALWDKTLLQGKITVTDIVPAVALRSAQARQNGVDIVVVLSHSGIGDAVATPGMENASHAIVHLGGIDALFTGHSHLVFPGPDFETLTHADHEKGLINGVPTIMPGYSGSHLGVIDLSLQKDQSGWQVTKSKARAIPVNGSTKKKTNLATQVMELTAPAHTLTIKHLAEPISKTEIPLHSYLAFIQSAPSVLIAAKAQAIAAKEQLVGSEFDNLPLLSAAAPFKAGGSDGSGDFTDVPVGTITRRHLADLYFYPNALAVLQITGEMLKDWLEFAASAYNKLLPNDPDQTLLDLRFAPYLFDTLLGVNYSFDLSQPARYAPDGTLVNPKATRVFRPTYNGESVTDDQVFLVATNDYRASRTGAFPGADQGQPVPIKTERNRDALMRYLRREAQVTSLPNSPFSFRSLKNTSAKFLTSLEAEVFADAHPQITHIRQRSNGRAEYRLDLQLPDEPTT